MYQCSNFLSEVLLISRSPFSEVLCHLDLFFYEISFNKKAQIQSKDSFVSLGLSVLLDETDATLCRGVLNNPTKEGL